MSYRTRRLGGLVAGVLLGASAAAQEVTLDAAAETGAGAVVEIAWAGGAPQDFITIVAADTPEGRYDAYQYARQNPVKLEAPATAGRYEIRLLGAAAPYPTLARRPLTVIDVTATLAAPDAVAAGAEFSVEWTGPDNPRDFVTIVTAQTPEGQYGVYAYTRRGSPLTLRAPEQPGAYELRYLLGAGQHRTVGRRPLRITAAAAALTAPETAPAGALLEIAWQGPDDRGDFISIVPAAAAPRSYDAYVYTERGNPAELAVPEVAGSYEIRYLSGQGYATLASAPLLVTAVSATLEAPSTAPARAAVDVAWQGPGNPTDYVVLLPVGSDNRANGPYATVTRGSTLRIATPEQPGEYELRYVTAGARLTLGKRPITIVPRAASGSLQVVAGGSGAEELAGATVAVVLDASGSMLQRLDGQRRIDLAKAAITGLVSETLPDSVDFTLRVFGHKEADACRSDLEIPAGPLDRSGAAAVVASIEAMNLARTPIAESLRRAAADAAGRPGPLMIVLVTDGEETCGGDPAAVIEELAAAGTDVRVNIVGFAIDELMLQETFAEWAQRGRGRYFNAADGAALAASLRESVETPFSVLDADGRVITSGTVNGPAVTVDAGTWRVVVPSDPARSATGVVVSAEAQTRIEL